MHKYDIHIIESRYTIDETVLAQDNMHIYTYRQLVAQYYYTQYYYTHYTLYYSYIHIHTYIYLTASLRVVMLLHIHPHEVDHIFRGEHVEQAVASEQ